MSLIMGSHRSESFLLSLTSPSLIMLQLTWLSHATWMIEHGSMRVLLDPFFSGNPAAEVSAEEMESVTHILVSHGHFDHVADVVSIAKRTGAMVLANFEIVQWLNKQGVENATAMNIGGTASLMVDDVELARAKMVPAIHSSGLPDGSVGGSPSGFVLHADGKKIYFACDTAYYGDMKFYAGGVDVAVVPIGDLFTMGVEDAVAAIELISPKIALPTHYNTWPPIEQDAVDWAAQVEAKTDAQAKVLSVGGSLQVE